MLNGNLRWSNDTQETLLYKERVEELYKKGLEMINGGKLYGRQININNPKEVIASLFLLAEDFNRYHERF